MSEKQAKNRIKMTPLYTKLAAFKANKFVPMKVLDLPLLPRPPNSYKYFTSQTTLESLIQNNVKHSCRSNSTNLRILFVQNQEQVTMLVSA